MSIASTAAEEEISRFSAIADEWWDEGGKFRALHALNPVRIQFVRDTFCEHFSLETDTGQPLKGLRLLDAGCGGGLLSEPLARMGADLTAIDADAKTVAVAATHAAQAGLEISYRQATPEMLAQERLTFDGVISLEVIEHVKDLDAFLTAVSKLVKPGGCMILGTINRTMKSLVLAKVMAEYVLRWIPAGTHDWNKFVRPSELASALGNHGMVTHTIKGTVYNPLSDTWRLSRDTAVNYLAYFAGNADC